MGTDGAAQIFGHHLGTETDTEQRRVLGERNRDPVDLTLDEFIGVICAHRPAEDHSTRMLGKRAGKGFAEARAANVEYKAFLAQHRADAARC